MSKYLFLSLFLFSTSLFAVVQIAPNEVGLRPGLSGKVQLAINTQRGNTDKDEYNVGGLFSYDNNRSYVTWIDFLYAYGQAAGVENANKAYAHFRFLHTLYSPAWNWEAYAQNQGDDFRHIQRRLLGGGGLRWRFYESEAFGRIYFGLGGYYEYLDYTTDIDPKERNVRMSSYLSYTKKLGKDARFSVSSYFQPELLNWDDHYVHHTASLFIYIYGSLFIKVSLLHAYDNRPAIGVEKTDLQQITSIGWKFGAKSNR